MHTDRTAFQGRAWHRHARKRRQCGHLIPRRRTLILRRAMMIAITAIPLALCLPLIASASKDSIHHESILYTCQLNADCHVDTIVGWMDDAMHYLPHLIRWGTGPEDSCASQTPKKNRVTETEIIYPNWKRITGSVSFERMNDDSLTDMVLYLVGDASNGDEKHDTLRPLVLFGQVSLDEVKEIRLGTIGKFQTEPYFAMELARDVDLRDPKVRDISGRPSYALKRVALDVKKKKDTVNGPEAPPIAGSGDAGVKESDHHVSVHLYPNPSSTETQIEALPVAPGEYTIEVVALNGTVALRQEVTVTASQSLFSSLDVSELASGYYALRLHASADHGGTRHIGTYPIIITR